MDLVVHIGAHKTGSTSIQDFCFLNQDLLLREGIYYPIGFFHQFPRQHSELMQLVAGDNMNAVSEFFSDAAATARVNNVDTVFISGEDLSALGPGLARRMQAVCLQYFASMTVVLLLRNKKDYLYSSYKHNLLYGPPTGEIDFVRRQKFSPKDCVDSWSKIDGVKLKVLSFEAFKADLLASFFREIFGITVTDNLKSNRSLDYLTLIIMNSFLKGRGQGLERLVLKISERYPFDFTLPIENVIAENIDGQYSDIDWVISGIDLGSSILEKKTICPRKINSVKLCEKMIDLFTALKEHFESDNAPT